ncbi:PIN domain-containing protein [Micromonospora craniellae]|uniref:PIN domain-containing protein n=1 Tax=Micromonospora craniellae TaxID=2294034 RepID=A0A372FUZ3_9ACTN|nr:PIN domain-containing protein [Micromonospora craniellae]QOC92179.1 PIN domain-containing protein [Micromonospora craniellae]RFS44386.1 PIN domain-containing protein [Micromonospora craniellae]
MSTDESRVDLRTAAELTFVDTSAWRALLDRDDIHHEHVVAAIARCAPESLVTTRQITVEMSRRCAEYDDPLIAVTFTWRLWRGDFAQVIEPEPVVQQAAWERFKYARRTGASFVDCVSVTFIRWYGIRRVVAYGTAFHRLLDESRSGPDRELRAEA